MTGIKSKFILAFAGLFSSGPLLFALPKTIVTDSQIENVVKKSKITARNRSGVNVGVKLTNTEVKNSEIKSSFKGNVDARNSGVNTGVKVSNGKIEHSKIDTSSNVNISASNAQVNTGVAADSVRWSKISTSTSGNISATNSRVMAGAVEGAVSGKKISTSVGGTDIQAHGRSVSIGSVVVHDRFTSRSGAYRNKNSRDYKSTRSTAGAGAGNVEVDSSMVREVDVTVGANTKNAVKGLRTRHMAKFYADKGGVDETGRLHVYGKRRQRARAEKGRGSTANTYISRRNRKIRKVTTYVE